MRTCIFCGHISSTTSVLRYRCGQCSVPQTSTDAKLLVKFFDYKKGFYDLLNCVNKLLNSPAKTQVTGICSLARTQTSLERDLRAAVHTDANQQRFNVAIA